MSWEAWGTTPDPVCEMCGHDPASCVCPECPTCGEVGNPACYREHRLEETEEQIQGRIRNEPCPDDYF